MKKVTYAQFHGSIFIPGIGDCGQSLPPKMKTLGALDMYDTGTGLQVSAKGSNGVVTSALIPYPNIIIMVHAAEPKTDSTGTPVVTKAAKAHA